jgi:hypothetical protein
MTYVALLLDKAKTKVSPANYSGLADRMGVTRQLVSQWKNDVVPLPDERIAQLAKIAGEDAAKWLVAVHAERAHGEAKRGWLQAARQLGIAAAIVVGFALPGASRATTTASLTEQHSELGIMRSGQQTALDQAMGKHGQLSD